MERNGTKWNEVERNETERNGCITALISGVQRPVRVGVQGTSADSPEVLPFLQSWLLE